MSTQMTFGNLITALSSMPKDAPLRFPFCRVAPVSVSSYRGYYDQLAIEWQDGADTTVGGFLDVLAKALDQPFEGYKGGSYRMHADVAVWVANYSESHGIAVTGVVRREHDVLLLIAETDGYSEPGWSVVVPCGRCGR